MAELTRPLGAADILPLIGGLIGWPYGITPPPAPGLVTLPAGPSVTVPVGAATLFGITLAAASTTIGPSVPAGISGPIALRLILTRSGTGDRAVTWAGVTWLAGAPPALGLVDGAPDLVDLISPDGGATWYGQAPVPHQPVPVADHLAVPPTPDRAASPAGAAAMIAAALAPVTGGLDALATDVAALTVAAYTAAAIYPTPSAGLAATGVGQYFRVPSAVADELFVYYRVDAGPVATEVGRDLASAAIARASQVARLTDIILKLSRSAALYRGTGPVWPIACDETGRAVLAYNADTKTLVGSGLLDREAVTRLIRQQLALLGIASYTGSGDVVPIVLSEARQVMLGWDTAAQAAVGPLAAGLTATASATPTRQPLAAALASGTHNHVLGLGQSLMSGATALPPLSTAQSYGHVTFAGGPRAWNGSAWTYAPLRALTEDAVNPAPDGGSNRGETPLSGFAAATTEELLARGEIATAAEHRLLASVASHGGYRLDQLAHGTAWYAVLEAHLTQGHTLAAGHVVPVVLLAEGESDAADGTTEAAYLAELLQYAADVSASAIAVTGQSEPVMLLAYQSSYNVALHPGPALATRAAAHQSGRIRTILPTYHLPYNTDGTHLTARGSRLLGWYFGIAYADMRCGHEPATVDAVSATVRGAVVRVRLASCWGPVVLDTGWLVPPVTDYGLQVRDGGVPVAISSVTMDGADLVIALASAPTGAVEVRYGLDYLPAGININAGAAGNIRDSAPYRREIGGVEYRLYNPCLHFTLTATPLEI